MLENRDRNLLISTAITGVGSAMRVETKQALKQKTCLYNPHLRKAVSYLLFWDRITSCL